MPVNKRKNSKRGSKAKKAAKARALLEKEEAMVKSRRFLKLYQTHCAASDSSPSPKVISGCRESMEDDKSLTKFIMEAAEPHTAAATTELKSAGTSKSQTKSISGHVGGAESSTVPPPPVQPTLPVLPITLPPLFKALTESSYDYMRALHVWGISINDDGAVSIALFLESSLGANLKVLELRNTSLTPWALVRLARPLGKVHLTQLNLDYNEIHPDVLTKLCEKMQANVSLDTLSLNYCKLDSTCGGILGGYLATSQVKSLFIMGNFLQCNGCNDLVRPLVSICESSSFNAIKVDTDTSQKKDDSKTVDSAAAATTAATLPPVQTTSLPVPAPASPKAAGEPSTSRSVPLPPLCRLDLRDNAIDAHGVCGNEEQTFEPILCMRTVKRWMIACPNIEELNLDHNQIGDGGARELLQGLVLRKEAGLPIAKVIVTVYISQETYQKIVEYSTPPKKRKGKARKKK